MNKQEKKEKVIYSINRALEGAWANPKNARYWLEQLPQCDGDYDSTVEEYITKLAWEIREGDREYFEMLVEDLVDYYCVDFEDYEF